MIEGNRILSCGNVRKVLNDRYNLSYTDTSLDEKPACMGYIKKLLKLDISSSALDDRLVCASNLKKLLTLVKPYTKLEYVQFNASQYIRTGFYPNNNTRVVADIYCDSDQPSSLYAVYGGRKNRHEKTYSFWVTKTSTVRFDYGSEQYSVSFKTPGQRFTVDTNKNVLYINSTEKATATSETFVSPYELLIGSNNQSDGTLETRCFKGRIYSFKIYDNNTLVRDYIPIKKQFYKINDQELFLYSLHTFFK